MPVPLLEQGVFDPPRAVEIEHNGGWWAGTQVTSLLLPHLADDDPRRPNPQRLLDHQLAQRDPAGALESGLAGLHRLHVDGGWAVLVTAKVVYRLWQSSPITTLYNGGRRRRR